VKRNTSGLKRGGPGRPKGSPNKATVAVREAAKMLVEDDVYRAKLQKRLREGRIAPAMESLLWFYAYGKPKEQVEHSGMPEAFTLILSDHKTSDV
jgi:hypothetical protein